jgi:hypothetical protein
VKQRLRLEWKPRDEMRKAYGLPLDDTWIAECMCGSTLAGFLSEQREAAEAAHFAGTDHRRWLREAHKPVPEGHTTMCGWERPPVFWLTGLTPGDNSWWTKDEKR